MRFGKAICMTGLIGLAASGMALASEVTFTVDGTFNDGAALSGTFLVDTGAGTIESDGLDLTLIGGEAGSGLVFDTLEGSGIFNDGTNNLWYAYINATDSNDPGPGLQLDINLGGASSLAGFTGGTLCYVPASFPANYPRGNNCGPYFSTYELRQEDPQLLGGSAVPSSAPEPASLLLLAAPAALLIRRQLRPVLIHQV